MAQGFSIFWITPLNCGWQSTYVVNFLAPAEQLSIRTTLIKLWSMSWIQIGTYIFPENPCGSVIDFHNYYFGIVQFHMDDGYHPQVHRFARHCGPKHSIFHQISYPQFQNNLWWFFHPEYCLELVQFSTMK